ncbi:MAG TPA: hypothetical protein VFR35_13805 [Actinoplanes sp.]|nr:hypothetical protein [Actinoplanes sp.]
MPKPELDPHRRAYRTDAALGRPLPAVADSRRPPAGVVIRSEVEDKAIRTYAPIWCVSAGNELW